jgi:sirohydrochlorin cobaltochelatase
MQQEPHAARLANAVSHGFRRIGQISIQTNDSIYRFILSHETDVTRAILGDASGLEIHRGADAARGLSLYSDDGAYRFAKAQANLRCGWVLLLDSPAELLRALDGFYPASVGVWLAQVDGALEVENLRDKLDRQTGMYRFARTISDEGAQQLVQEICGPAHQCARRILWQIDAQTPLAGSEASRFDGLPAGASASEAIPLLCREACNHFVAECRTRAKREHTEKTQQ